MDSRRSRARAPASPRRVGLWRSLRLASLCRASRRETCLGARSPAAFCPSFFAGFSAALDLSVAASASTHVRILGDGKLLFDGDLPGGDTRHFQALDRFEVS